MFIIGIVLLSAGSLFALGFTMKYFGLAPDDHPAILIIGAIGCLLLTYYVGKWLHRWLSR